jgi:23S rRNA pseudouridine2605 synthase
MTQALPIQGERIAKVLARRGVCSRREAERLIAEGLVSVDGAVLTTPAVKVGEAASILVRGRLVPPEARTRMWRYHKPAGLMTTHNDPQGRPTVFERLPPELPRVVSIGRLDLSSEGLLLLTNDGAIARALELPSMGWRRRYRVRIFGKPVKADLDRLTAGILVDGVRLKAEEAKLDSSRGDNSWLTIVLTEGKNREIRRMVEAIGARVNRLIRVSYGAFQLGELTRGAIEEVPPKVLREQLGSLVKAPARKRHADRGR